MSGTLRARTVYLMPILAVLTAVSAGQAEAMPGFARSSEQSCTACHSAWPFLSPPDRGGGEEIKLFPKDGPAVGLRGVGSPGEFRPSIRIRSTGARADIWDSEAPQVSDRGSTAIQIIARPIEKVFFDVRYSDRRAGGFGPGISRLDGRVALGVTPYLSVGAFGGGSCLMPADTCGPESGGQWRGLDARLDFGNTRISASYMGIADAASDRANREQDTAWRLEGAHVLTRNGRPFAVPLLRFDQYEKAMTAETRDEVTLNIAFFPWENVRLRAEWWNQVAAPEDEPKGERFSILFDINF